MAGIASMKSSCKTSRPAVSKQASDGEMRECPRHRANRLVSRAAKWKRRSEEQPCRDASMV